jgi:hypothetical protein
MVWGSSGANLSHALVRTAPAEDGSVAIRRFGINGWSASRLPDRTPARCLKSSPTTMSPTAFRFMDFREMDVRAPCMVNRITYTGDLGYEIWMAPAYQRRSMTASRRQARSSALSISACARCSRCGSRRTSRPGSANSGRSTAPMRPGWPLRQARRRNSFESRPQKERTFIGCPRLWRARRNRVGGACPRSA